MLSELISKHDNANKLIGQIDKILNHGFFRIDMDLMKPQGGANWYKADGEISAHIHRDLLTDEALKESLNRLKEKKRKEISSLSEDIKSQLNSKYTGDSDE